MTHTHTNLHVFNESGPVGSPEKDTYRRLFPQQWFIETRGLPNSGTKGRRQAFFGGFSAPTVSCQVASSFYGLFPCSPHCRGADTGMPFLIRLLALVWVSLSEGPLKGEWAFDTRGFL